MKRQRDTQQVNNRINVQQTKQKREEIGNLPDKEFQIMIVKMVQNLKNEMDLQINSLDTRIEKRQERFNKDTEEIKKNQYITNIAITETKNTLREPTVE